PPRARPVRRVGTLRPSSQPRARRPKIAGRRRLPLRTLARWVQRYRAAGLVGLVRKRRRDAGHHRPPLTLQQLIEGLALQTPPLSLRAIHRHVSALAAQQALTPPS